MSPQSQHSASDLLVLEPVHFPLITRPYPGLRTFLKQEWPIYFGREETIATIVDRLIKTGFVVVHGESGCGKSSIIRAGVLPRLEMDHSRGGVTWRTATLVPGTSPLRNLAYALSQLTSEENRSTAYERYRHILNLGADAAAEIAQLVRRDEHDFICILIDQFEELFAYASNARAEAQVFADVLAGMHASPANGVHVALTMRSEFLGSCARYPGLAHVINRSQFLLPRMEESDLLRAINQPALLCGGKIEPRLAQQLLAETSTAEDQLPLVQHTLMCLWDTRAGAENGEPASLPIELTFDLYNNLGGVSVILETHANKTIEAIHSALPSELTPEQRVDLVARFFKSLTDVDRDGRLIRRPQSLNHLKALLPFEESAVRVVINTLVADGVSFIKIMDKSSLDESYTIDITHEALIRNWSKLNAWTLEEAEDAKLFDRISFLASKFLNDRTSTLSERQIREYAAWWGRVSPSDAWAARHGRAGEEIARIQELLGASRLELGSASFAWPPPARPDAIPYPGLESFREDDAGILFGRETELRAAFDRLRALRGRGAPRIITIVAASGAGKSSFLRAGLWPRLQRTTGFLPLCVVRPGNGIFVGEDGIVRGLATWFESRRVSHARSRLFEDLTADSDVALAEQFGRYLSEAVKLELEVQTVGREKQQHLVSPIIAIDQGEELFTVEHAEENEKFLRLIKRLLEDPPHALDPFIVIAIRADAVDRLLQHVTDAGLETPEALYLAPLSRASYRDIIVKPAERYSEGARRLMIDPALVDRLIEDATGADALPLLAFTLNRLFHESSASGALSLEQYIRLGGIQGALGGALSGALERAGAAGTSDNLRRLIIPGLAGWDANVHSAKRRVARIDDLLSGSRSDLQRLADSLVEQRLLTRTQQTIEISHEALLRRPPISDWLEGQKDSLKLLDDVLREAKEWSEGGRQYKDCVRRGERLKAAIHLRGDADFAKVLLPADDYITACERLEYAGRRKARRTQAGIYMLMLGIIASLLGVIFKSEIEQFVFALTTERYSIATRVRPYVLTAAAERTLRPGDSFRECARDCPEMVVLPAGSFQMGSAEAEAGRYDDEGPAHVVTFATPFAVAKFTVTWDEWEACVELRGCDGRTTGDSAFGKSKRPVINVSWDQASSYAAWLSRMTGRKYRLLTEAEWEYAARGATRTAYYFGDDTTDVCRRANLADQSFKRGGYSGESVNCDDGYVGTAPVGSYPPNPFGLYDMAGNVWQWVEDCYADTYRNVPADGSANPALADCQRVIRGGSASSLPQKLRSAGRDRLTPQSRLQFVGFRIARSLESDTR